MKFIAKAPAFILGQYIVASPQQPAVIELPNDVKPDHVSSAWDPADDAAVAYLKKQGQKDAVVEPLPDGSVAVKPKADEDAIQVTKVPTGKLPGA